MKRLLSACVVVVLASAGAAFAQGAKRPLSLDDLGKLKDVRDPQCAPDGKSVAFVVSQIDHRYERYLAWYERYINGKQPSTTSTAQQNK